MEVTDEEKQFLKEYRALCKKYKMGLRGCGCCGSPYLNYIENINYEYKNYKGKIIDDVLVNDMNLDEFLEGE